MKRDNKLRTASLLMTTSILLLVVLQAYWLRNAWFDEYRRLKRELSVSLRETVMQDQMQKFIRFQNAADTTAFEKGDKQWESTDSGVIINRRRTNVVFNLRADSGRLPMPPRVLTIEQEKHLDEVEGRGPLVVGFPLLTENSNLDTIRKNYTKSLADAGINLNFSLRIVKNDNGHFFKGDINVRNPSGKRNIFKKFSAQTIEAVFENPFLLLLKKIEWQLLFALIMIAVTSMAFIFLYRNLRQQQRLAQMKNDFISNITHELKTPIATVSVAIEALKNFDAMHDAAKTRTYLDISGNELQRLNMLVDRVLKLSLFEQHQVNMQFEKLDMHLLLQEVLTSMKMQFEKQAALVEFTTAGDSFMVMGDRMHLISVFYNLLDNALKYSPVDPKIEVSLATMENKLVISISDNGIGIPEAYRDKIFDKFFRVPHGNTHNIKGYGLGLSYVQEVVKQHGGNIKVESGEGGGTVFRVVLNREV